MAWISSASIRISSFACSVAEPSIMRQGCFGGGSSKQVCKKFEEEFDLILKDGVHYDLDSSGSFTDSEKQAFYKGRLIR